MSLFSDHIINEIKMEERFKIAALSYDEGWSKSINSAGDPLSMLHSQAWQYPYSFVHMIEPRYWNRVYKPQEPIGQPFDVNYFYCPEKFTCTCEGDRVTIYRHEIIKKEYQYLLMSTNDIPFLSVLLSDSLRRAKIDELFTPQLFGPDDDFKELRSVYPWTGRPIVLDNYRGYWGSVSEKMINMMQKMIDPRFKVCINCASSNTTSAGASLWFTFTFVEMDNKPLYWWYTDMSKNTYLNYSGFHMSEPLSISPSFDVYVDMKIIK